MTDDLSELRDRIEALENRVDDLEGSGTTAAPGGIDQYDGYVLQKIESVGREPTPRTVKTWYQEAGIRDTSKIKQRHKFLKKSGRIEDALAESE